MSKSLDSFKCRQTLTVGGKTYVYYSPRRGREERPHRHLAAALLDEGAAREPAALRGRPHGHQGRHPGRRRLARQAARPSSEIAYRPARVLMQDFTGVPAVVDLAAMRDAMKTLGGDPQKINPLVPVDLVIDHSVIVDEFGTPQAFAKNVELEYERNGERYRFLKWGQKAFDNFRVVPPGTGICHQVNLEYPVADRVDAQVRGGRRASSPIPTPSSAPTRTPPWSTASPCSAGASAASRRRRRCSASRSRC